VQNLKGYDAKKGVWRTHDLGGNVRGAVVWEGRCPGSDCVGERMSYIPGMQQLVINEAVDQ